MELTVESISKLIVDKKGICAFYDDKIFENVVSDLNPKEINGISNRSIYYWRRKERPMPIFCLVDICENRHNFLGASRR